MKRESTSSSTKTGASVQIHFGLTRLVQSASANILIRLYLRLLFSMRSQHFHREQSLGAHAKTYKLGEYRDTCHLLDHDTEIREDMNYTQYSPS